MTQQVKCQLNWNATNNKMLTKQKYHQHRNFNKKWDVTKTQKSQKLKSNQKWNVTKTLNKPMINITKIEISQNLTF